MDTVKLKQARQRKDAMMGGFVWIAAGLTVGFYFGSSGTSYRTA
ncbi:hypothetical protein JCM19241_5099 [Vibrio ishigakensis]|uniref:Uncharacterized protein n=1 Tax=Vibrio ishigakensis TaxID=1481914 RepID=A0A0B8QFI9_9VIBR|nr:hypothetical protein JCM19241_5099 [Vibrio ishigakensis]